MASANFKKEDSDDSLEDDDFNKYRSNLKQDLKTICKFFFLLFLFYKYRVVFNFCLVCFSNNFLELIIYEYGYRFFETLSKPLLFKQKIFY